MNNCIYLMFWLIECRMLKSFKTKFFFQESRLEINFVFVFVLVFVMIINSSHI
jgi:hypothetical protein